METIFVLLKVAGLLTVIVLPLFKRRAKTKPTLSHLSRYAVDKEGCIKKVDEVPLDRHHAH